MNYHHQNDNEEVVVDDDEEEEEDEHEDRYDFEPLESSTSFLLGDGTATSATAGGLFGVGVGHQQPSHGKQGQTSQQTSTREWKLPLEFQQQNGWIYECKRYGWHLWDIMERQMTELSRQQRRRSKQNNNIDPNNPYGVYKKPSSNPNSNNVSWLRSLWIKVIRLPMTVKLLLIGAFCIGMLFGYDLKIGKEMKYQQQQAVVIGGNDTRTTQAQPIRAAHSTKELLGWFTQQKSILWSTTLEKEFGSFKGIIFGDSNFLMRHVLKMNDVSKERFIRKLVMKVLEAQIKLHTHDNNNKKKKKQKRSTGKDDILSSSSSSSSHSKTYLTWMTTGDSAAAGHGNMYGQSYTSILENTVSNAFRVVGIEFQSFNRAIGNSNSGLETSLCMTSLFGVEEEVEDDGDAPTTTTKRQQQPQRRRMIDVVSWDYSRTDRGDPYDQRVKFWAQRASMINRHMEAHDDVVNSHSHIGVPPILFMMDSSERSAWSLLSEFEHTHSMSTILMDEHTMGTRWNGRLPDSLAANNISPEHIPDGLRYYMCNGHVEGSIACHVDDQQPLLQAQQQPSEQQQQQQYTNHWNHYWCDTLDPMEQERCLLHKYNTHQFCSSSSEFGQTSWNPGWKHHNLLGRLIGYALLELLEEALRDIDSALSSGNKNNKSSSSFSSFNVEDAIKLLQTLQAQEQYELLHSEANTNAAPGSSTPTNDDPTKLLIAELNNRKHRSSNAICRTGLLPSYSSLTYGLREESMILEHYHQQQQQQQEPQVNLPLIMDSKERPIPHCDGLKFDFHDYFAIFPSSSSSTTQFPSMLEYQAYGSSTLSSSSSSSSILILCPRYCKRTPTTHSNCHLPDVLKPHEWITNVESPQEGSHVVMGEPTFHISVNDIKVTQLIKYDECYVLVPPSANNHHGLYWPTTATTTTNDDQGGPSNNNNEKQGRSHTRQQPQQPSMQMPQQRQQPYTLTFSSDQKQVQISSIIALESS